MSGLKNNVPATMRKTLDKAEIILPVVISQHYGGDLNEAIEFISGALNHQQRVGEQPQGLKPPRTFPVIIDKVEFFERRFGGALLGRKAKIHFHDAKDKSSDPESIDTGWIEYNGNDAREYSAWQTSLSNTLVAVAEDNIGKECFLTKAYVPGVKTKHNPNGGEVKFLANLEPAGGKDSSGGGDRKASAGASRRSSNEITIGAFEEYVDGVKDATDAQVDDVLGNDKLLKLMVSAINNGGAKEVLNVVIKANGDGSVTRKIEDDFFDAAENNLAKAAARLVAVTA